MRDLIGRTLGHYRIVEKIGEGGMGVVYRAHDERLEREVAIKVLPEKVAGDSDRLRRFEREAKAVAALSHPNILEIFDFDTESEVTYAVTELLEGETLREHIERTGGPLACRKVQEIGSSVANGLGAAHSKGVIHRDIKPSNIFMCSDGRVKILDFGLAASSGVVDSEAETGSLEKPLTREGTVIGTVGYMAPEQVRGEAADARTDIFALGCVLYEMLTGKRAFKRDTTAEIMTAILREEPPSFTEAGVQVAPEVENTTNRCLEKSPERRFQSASDLAFALGEGSRSASASMVKRTIFGERKWWFAFGTAAIMIAALVAGVWFTREQVELGAVDLDPKKVVIAVFENRTGDPSLNALGTLIPEALSEGASAIGDFSTAPSPEAFSGRTVGDDSNPGSRALRGLAEETGSGLVVSGSYYLIGNDLRIQAQLIDATSAETLHSAPAVTGPRDLPGEVIEELRQRLLGAIAWYYDRDEFQQMTPPLLAAYLEYQRGLEFFMNDVDAFVLHMRRATELDPSFFYAWYALHVNYSNLRICNLSEQVLDEMRDNLALFTAYERLFYRGERAWDSGNYSSALATVRQMDLITGGRNTYKIGLCSIALNHPLPAREAFSQLPEPTTEKPVSSWGFFWLARANHMIGEYGWELGVVDKYLEYFPTNRILYGRKIAALVALGRLEKIDVVIDDAALIQDENYSVMVTMVGAAGELRAHGYRDEARRMADRAVTWYEAQQQLEQEDLRPLLVDALTLADEWLEAKTVADNLLKEFDSVDGRIEEEGRRARGDIWWGDSSLVVSLGRVGTLAASLGNYDEAQRITDRLRDFDSSCPAGNRTYQRACIAAQLGNPAEAIQLLKKAVSQGFWGFWGMETDFNLEPLKDNPEFVDLMRPKG